MGLAGLIIAAILAAAMANLSAALNSLASTTVVDFLRARGKQMSEQQSMKIARWATVGWGLVLLAIAYRRAAFEIGTGGGADDRVDSVRARCSACSCWEY